MAQALGSNHYTALVKETTPGTTPTTPSLVSVLGIQNNTLDGTVGNVVDNAINSDGMEKFIRTGNKAVGGTLTVSAAPGTHDALLEAAAYGTWASNVLKNGTTENSYTIEVGHPSISKYRQFKGCHVSSYKLNIPSGNSQVTAEFDIIGTDFNVATSPLDAAVEAPTLDGIPFVHFDGTYSIGGSAAGNLTGLTLNLTNTLTANPVLGSKVARSVTRTNSQLSGTATMYFETDTLFQAMLNETSLALGFTLSSNSVTHTYNIPAVRVLSHTTPVSNGGPVIATVTWRALKDATLGAYFSITRS